MIADTHNQQQSRKAMSTLLIGFSFAPNVAIAISGFLVTHISWSSIDYFVLVYYLIVLLTLTRLTETLPSQARVSIQPAQVIKGFIRVGGNPRYWSLVLIASIGTNASYLFNGLAPGLALENLRIRADLYGSLSLIPAAGYFSGSFISSQLSGRFSAKQVILIGLTLLLIASLGLSILVLLGYFNLITLFAAGFLFFLASALISANAVMLTLNGTTDKANGAALMNGANLAITSAALFTTGSLISHSPLVLPTSLLSAGIVGLVLLLLLR
jgi:DHA1 family bicyclomycin/chloramphenicol resistance-like MFS transporter